MGVWHTQFRHLVLAVVALCFFVSGAHADSLYSVKNFGATSPSGKYLNALGAADQTAFRTGSFDVYAHPASGVLPTFYANPGWVWDMAWTQSAYNSRGSWQWIQGISLSTSNNRGQEAGVGTAMQEGRGEDPPQLVLFTPAPHTVTPGVPLGQPPASPIQSPGYLSTITTDGPNSSLVFLGSISGLNDHDSVIMNQQTLAYYPSGGGPTTAYVQIAPIADWNNPITDLGTLGGTSSFAGALNNSNQVVGWSQIASGAQHAFLWMNGTMQDLNLLIPTSSGITLVDAVGIDASGRIVAYGTDASGRMNEYLLTPLVAPAPEPSTILIFGGGVLAVLAHRLRSRRVGSRRK